jgi:hypothetical protein
VLGPMFSGGMKPSVRKQGVSWRNIAETLERPMSTIVDDCRECSENIRKGRRREQRKHNPLPANGLPFNKQVFSEHLCYAKFKRAAESGRGCALQATMHTCFIEEAFPACDGPCGHRWPLSSGGAMRQVNPATRGAQWASRTHEMRPIINLSAILDPIAGRQRDGLYLLIDCL